MKHIYIAPVIRVVNCRATNMFAASTTTGWVMNPDGNNGKTIEDGNGHDPDADSREWNLGTVWDD